MTDQTPIEKIRAEVGRMLLEPYGWSDYQRRLVLDKLKLAEALHWIREDAPTYRITIERVLAEVSR